MRILILLLYEKTFFVTLNFVLILLLIKFSLLFTGKHRLDGEIFEVDLGVNVELNALRVSTL